MYQITGTSIPTANVNAYTVDDIDPDNNWIQCDNDGAAVADGQELFLDIDYLGEPHDGAQIKIAYEQTPYQGLVANDGTVLSGQLKQLSGFVHSDGTANVTDNIDTLKFAKPLISFLPTPKDVEFSIAGGAVAGTGLIGKHNGNPNPYSFNAQTADLSNTTDLPLKIDDTITGKYEATYNLVERGGNDATTNIALMVEPLLASTYKQAVAFGLAVTGDNFDVKDELVLYVWTYTNNDADNELISTDNTTIGVDFYFIKNRPLVKIK